MEFNDHHPPCFQHRMPQPLQSRVDCHQGGHDLHPIMTGTTGIHFPGDLVQVVTHTGKLAQQRGDIDGSLPARAGFSSRQV
jgi:hypothetical protein